MQFKKLSLISTLSLVSAFLCANGATAEAPSQAPAQAPAQAGTAAQASEQKTELKELRTEAEIRNEKLAAELASLKAEIDRLRTEGQLAEQKQAQALQQVMLEKGKLEAELALMNARETTSSAPDRSKIETLQRAQKLRDAQLGDELSGLSAEQIRMKQGLDVEATKLQVELSKSKIELERTSVAEAVLDMKTKTAVGALKRQIEQLSAENALAAEKRKSDQSKLADEQLRATAAVITLGAQIQNRDLEDKWRDTVNTPVQYTNEPFKDGVLTVSDRRIEMNGPIVSSTADSICDRIDYFNNQDRTKPIFVMINNSPGGSVMAGYRILKAIETSQAPIHVVVESFAASMAATIATLAPHSYAYPNAIILHHQMSGSAVGNMTNMEQEVATMQEWERRLAVPIAKKMGITLEQFKAKMYAAKKSGDWDEFADKAIELKWIDHIVNQIREQGVRSKPSPSGSGSWWMSAEKSDEQGKPYVSLPPLEPYDCYFMINPHGFYRVDGR
ncbi:MAG: ATP-dependent Clp protease proteolytic subunit [Planctomycetota bacterium]|nr:ATP-dependent Clp protease proteolytic subunit [Planctomycetota bacterium]